MTKGIRVCCRVTALVVVAIVIVTSIVSLRCSVLHNPSGHDISFIARSSDDGSLQWLFNKGRLKLESFVPKVEIGL